MASIIRIKRSSTSGNPSTLGAGELAYSALTDNGSNGGDRLYIGMGTETAGNAVNHVVIGGKYFTDMLDQTPGVLTASSAIVVDSSKKIDDLYVDNLQLNGNTLSTTNTNGNLIIDANGSGKTIINDKTTIVSQVLKASGSSLINVFNVEDTTGAQLFEVRENGDAVLGGVLTVNGTGTSTFAGNVSINGNINVSGTATVTLGFSGNNATLEGNLVVKGNTTLGDASTDTLTINARLASSLIPSVSGTYDLGSSSLTYNNVYATAVSAGSLKLSGNTLQSTNTNGDINITPNGSGKTVLSNVYIGVDSLTEYIQDVSGGQVVGGNAITITYDDTAGTTTVAANTATTTTLGVASFNTNNFTVTSGAVSTKNITLGSSTLTNGSTTTAIAGLTQLTVDNIDINGNTITATNTNGNVNLAPNGTGTVDVGSKRITSVAEPTQATDAATKNYVDAVKTGLDVKDSVRVATTANLTATYSNGTNGVGATLTNSNTQAALTIDSIVLTAGDRVLVKDQTTQLQNGIYVVTDAGSASTNWVLTRATDSDSNSPIVEVGPGMFTFVEEGTSNADNGYVCTNNGAITIGTTAITWVQFSGAGQIVAGAGLTKTGNTIDVVGTANRITVNADSIDIASTYVGQNTITTLGTVTTGTWNAAVIAGQYGGTGVANTGKTITLGGNLTTSGAFASTFTMTAATSVTFPTTGTLATLAGTESLSNKTITASSFSGTTVTASGAVSLTGTTDASSTTTGILQVAGGVGIAKSVYVGLNLTGAGPATSTLDGFNIDGGTY